MSQEQPPWQLAITICRARKHWPIDVVNHLELISRHWTAESSVALARDIGWPDTPTPWELEPMRRCCLAHSPLWCDHFFSLAQGTLEAVGRVTPHYQVEQKIGYLSTLIVGLPSSPARYSGRQIRLATGPILH